VVRSGTTIGGVPGHGEWLIVRFNPDGTLDGGFGGGDGIVTFDFSSGEDHGHALSFALSEGLSATVQLCNCAAQPHLGVLTADTRRLGACGKACADLSAKPRRR
jgi:hypothetical protein